jgi:hypothetical protein
MKIPPLFQTSEMRVDHRRKLAGYRLKQLLRHALIAVDCHFCFEFDKTDCSHFVQKTQANPASTVTPYSAITVRHPARIHGFPRALVPRGTPLMCALGLRPPTIARRYCRYDITALDHFFVMALSLPLSEALTEKYYDHNIGCAPG